MSKKPMTFIISDDDEYCRKRHSEDIREHFPEANIVSFSDFMDVRDYAGSVDFLIVDMSSIAPIMSGPEFAYSPICSFIEQHPGAEIVICSAVAKSYSENVKDRVVEIMPGANITVLQFMRDMLANWLGKRFAVSQGATP